MNELVNDTIKASLGKKEDGINNVSAVTVSMKLRETKVLDHEVFLLNQQPPSLFSASHREAN